MPGVKPIIFQDAMVRALLEGRKTQTRRVMKPQPPTDEYQISYVAESTDRRDEGKRYWVKVDGLQIKDRFGPISSPPGQPGDLLWVREACRAEELDDSYGPIHEDSDPNFHAGLDGVRYLADKEFRKIENSRSASDAWSRLHDYGTAEPPKAGNRVPSIHMPRWASRLTLRLTDVRVERVQEVSEGDAEAEGVQTLGPKENVFPLKGGDKRHWRERGFESDAQCLFSDLWGSINASKGYGWDANPWAWVLEFQVIHANVDQVLKDPAAYGVQETAP